ncbi:hypothetical protein JOF36_003849 [Pseudonocardia parietis]|uniref:Uncharacterized protein n=1 Tax=Pseudonocardia parietis TaxID=570936 RepID=A0ABS4VWP9_9PSEU|nr:hypothetical protein [Pseudonocardia parietis]
MMSQEPPAPTSAAGDYTLRDTTVRLGAEFAGQVSVARVAAVVAGARDDLDSVPPLRCRSCSNALPANA